MSDATNTDGCVITFMLVNNKTSVVLCRCEVRAQDAEEILGDFTAVWPESGKEN